MDYDYIKHTITQLGKTCKRLKEHYELVKTDITVTPSIICITIEASTQEYLYSDFKCSAERTFFVYYQSDRLTEYMCKLKRRLERIEKELKEYINLKLEEKYKVTRVFEHSEKDINNVYGKSVTKELDTMYGKIRYKTIPSEKKHNEEDNNV